MKKTICLNMIVKNEAIVMERCLASVKKLIDYWVIVDTGSTDGTQKIIEDFLKDIPGELYERPWVNFAFNRNEALLLAKSKGDYLLFIDADEFLEFSDSSSLPSLDKDYYMSLYLTGASTSLRTLLINCRFDWKWNGIIHENVECAEVNNRGILNQVMKRGTFDGNRSKDLQKKFRHDIELLERVAQKEPQNTRNRFHLARHYEAVHEYELALKNYEMRAMVGDSCPEVFYSFYRMGLIQKELGISSEIFINNYLKAFQSRTWRAEPLYSLTEYFMDIKSYFLGYLISKIVMTDAIFNDYYLTINKVYDYELLSQYVECAFRLGKYQEAYKGLKRLLAVQSLPSDIRVSSEKNLALPVFSEFKAVI